MAPGQIPQSSGPAEIGLYRIDSALPGEISHTISSRINADVAESLSYDLRIRYNFNAQDIPVIGGDYGNFTAVLDSTYYESWKLTPNPAIPDLRINLAGQYGRNEGLQDGGVPRWKGSASLRWNRSDHTLRFSGRYTHHMADLENSGFCVSSLSNASCRVDSWVTYDLFYQYRLQEFFGIPGETTLAFTVNNLFDRFPDPMETATTPYASSIARIWGRWYNFRIQHNF